MYPNKNTFLAEILSKEPEELLNIWFSGEILPHAFQSRHLLRIFFQPIKSDWEFTEFLAIGGTGSWRFSLNPNKNFREFSDASDIDVVNVSVKHFQETWDRLRRYHRRRWYMINTFEKNNLRRNGQNIYCGFASPKWIPDRSDDLRFMFLSRLETYSSRDVGYRTVNMMFFRNLDEAKDYYRRGIEIAKARI